eukprot:4945770-Lingulodinium_polyedra.AAC.1
MSRWPSLAVLLSRRHVFSEGRFPPSCATLLSRSTKSSQAAKMAQRSSGDSLGSRQVGLANALQREFGALAVHRGPR